MQRRRLGWVAAITLASAAAQAWAHGGVFQPPDPPDVPGGKPKQVGKVPNDPPPPPPPPPPAPPADPPPEAGAPPGPGGGGGGPGTPEGGGGGPSTPGGDGTGTGTGEPGGGQQPPEGRPAGPSTPGGSGGGGPAPDRPKRPVPGGGLSADHWTRWWYPNRLALLDLAGRVRDAQATTPHGEPGAPRAEMWRAQAQEALTLALSDPDDDVASGAAVALGKGGDANDAAPLIALLSNPRRAQQTREGAALGLGLLPVEKGGVDVRAALERVAADRGAPDRLRAFAVYALGLRGDAAAVPFLVDSARASEPEWDVSVAGATALGLSQCAMTLPDLERLLAGPKTERSRETMRRVYAAHGLARLSDPAAVAALRAAGWDDDEDVRRASILALGALAAADDAATAEYLIHELRRDKDRACRCMAAISLGRIGHARAAGELRWAYENGDALEQPFAALGLGLVARRTKDAEIAKFLARDLTERANAELRGALCIAVGLTGDLASAPAVRKIASERGDPEMRAQAAMALGLLGDRAGGPPVLRAMLRDAPSPSMQREAAFALGMLGDREAVDILLRLVADGGSVYVQGSAAVALGRIGGEESVAPLAAMLRDRDRPGISRAMASVALGLLIDRTEGRRLAAIGADLDWYALTPAVREILDIL